MFIKNDGSKSLYEVVAFVDNGDRSYSIRIWNGKEVAHGSSGAGAYGTFGSEWVHYGDEKDGGPNKEEYELFRSIDWSVVSRLEDDLEELKSFHLRNGGGMDEYGAEVYLRSITDFDNFSRIERYNLTQLVRARVNN